jgi:asparagine synthase (glutamine-hydrolysing)
MCAIFGIIGDSQRDILKKMSACQIYRGPDKQTFFISKKNKISIGMNRLSVIDKKKGKQPMLSYDKRYIGVFNGTIYNFKQIKEFLIKKKINFITNSDTEVLMNSYSYWGKKCFNYFDGMWAFAVFDLKTKNTLLSRDYVGQKPLFYFHDKNKLVFSSQLNGIFKYKDNFKISKNCYEDFLRFNHFPAPKTLYQKIKQVCPGEFIEFNNKVVKKKQYWNVENGGDYNLFFPKRKKNELTAVFSKTIKNYLIADKKVGLCLSGGMDSNLLKVHMIRLKNRINSFTIGFKDKTYDESIYVNNTIKNKNSKKILTQKNFINSFRRIKKNIFFPIGDSSLIPTYELFRLVKKKTNVSIGGDGGDEIFYGYLAFKGFYISKIIKFFLPNFLLKILKLPFQNIQINTGYLNLKKKIKLFCKYIDKDLFLINNLWISNFDNNDAEEYFHKKKNCKNHSLVKIKKLFTKNSDKMKFSQIYFIKYYLPTILSKIDFSSMLNSVECRSPYLSKDLLNFSIDLPSKENFNLFTNRKLMKKLFQDDLKHQKEIKKHGFAFNKNLLLKNVKLIKQNIDENLILNKKYFYEKYEEYIKGNFDNEQYLWNEIILNLSRQNLETA